MDTNVLGSSYPMILSECRICHDEDQDSNMETPCSCRGSLEYAHRKCVQRWCDEKGDTTCEICQQQFEPGYTAPPPPPFHCGDIPMNFRGDWGIISSRDLQTTGLTSMGEDFPDPNFDEYPIPTSRSLLCCRVVAVTFLVLLVLRHTLPFVLYETQEYSISLFMLLTLRTIGMLLPIYIMVKASTAIQRRRNQQVSSSTTVFSIASLDGENDTPRHQQESHFIHLP